MSSPAHVVTKDVQDQLLNFRKCRRKPGEVPYPFEYSNGMVDFDIWDHMFFVNSFRSLTMHRFERPPEVVLDLGCGGGFWTLEAAKQWKSSTIIGFDITDVQPNLHGLEHYRHLSRRVKWVHGNLLDGLPFPESQFDFVRIAYIGLGVPEDEWQFVLEACSTPHMGLSRLITLNRLCPGNLKSNETGGSIREEDLIFPCTTIPPEPPATPKLDLDLSLLNFSSASPAGSTQDLNTLSSLPDRKPPASPLRTKFQELTRAKTSSKSNLAHAASLLAESSFTSQASSENSVQQAPLDKHPQDHSRIKASWDAMLASRFLTPKLLAVLPFYISTFFEEVKPYPPLKIPLPPNSSSAPPLRSRHSADSFRPSSRGNLDTPFDLKLPTISRSTSKADGCSIRAVCSVKDFVGPSQWATIHLAKTVNTIVACKGPIWKEYERLYSEDFLLHQVSSELVTVRQVFERDWNSWLRWESFHVF
ncbi:hypothetical protein CC1G_06343 [Coprinopsis cinerea okayama7|uniref:Methyltransferase domain-containing protein n=1 Tax=Coprinopsis cinerea (strain Okayama-7 / 130 / ATCC MYA-4618 / FGSC 9003) TaxID=240176 RepID=A8NTL2_COPC7|nr:hypothetical protein CC1G_06343 [Coprinopsis cinerea okayama7\|eukprot:XP_001836258.2 hypothetical protein CC1G_06343 [Coprinopsis cinerea okayama7\